MEGAALQDRCILQHQCGVIQLLIQPDIKHRDSVPFDRDRITCVAQRIKLRILKIHRHCPEQIIDESIFIIQTDLLDLKQRSVHRHIGAIGVRPAMLGCKPDRRDRAVALRRCKLPDELITVCQLRTLGQVHASPFRIRRSINIIGSISYRQIR